MTDPIRPSRVLGAALRFDVIHTLAKLEGHDFLSLLVKANNNTSIFTTKDRLMDDLEDVCRSWLFIGNGFAVTVRRSQAEPDIWVARYQDCYNISAVGRESAEGLSKRHAIKRLLARTEHLQEHLPEILGTWATGKKAAAPQGGKTK